MWKGRDVAPAIRLSPPEPLDGLSDVVNRLSLAHLKQEMHSMKRRDA